MDVDQSSPNARVNMLLYAILACLCLIAPSSCYDRHFGYRTYNHKLPGARLNENSRYIISPDVLEYGESYVVAEHVQRNAKLLVNLFLLNDRPSKPRKMCYLQLQASPRALFMELIGVRRLNEDRVVLTWRYVESNVVLPLIRVTGYDINNCRDVELDVKTLTKEPIIVPTGRDKFVLFVNDAEVCRSSGHSKCWLSYDLSRNVHSTPRKFDVDKVDWSRLEIESLPNGNFQLHDARKVLLMNHTSYKRVMGVARGAGEIVGSGMSFCWHVTPENPLAICCKQMSDEGVKIFENTVMLDTPRAIVDVRPIAEGKILLLTRDKNCQESAEDCWNMKATWVIEGDEHFDDVFALACTGPTDDLVVFGLENHDGLNIEMHYGCPNGEQFYFGSVHSWRFLNTL